MLVNDVRFRIYMSTLQKDPLRHKGKKNELSFNSLSYLNWTRDNLYEAIRRGERFASKNKKAESLHDGQYVGIDILNQRDFNIWLAERHDYPLTSLERNAGWVESTPVREL